MHPRTTPPVEFVALLHTLPPTEFLCLRRPGLHAHGLEGVSLAADAARRALAAGRPAAAAAGWTLDPLQPMFFLTLS